MKIIGLDFSPAGSVCAELLESALASAAECGAEVGSIRMLEKHVGQCTSCARCPINFLAKKSTDFPVCVLEDDFAEVRDRIIESDGLIMASPGDNQVPSGAFYCLLNRMITPFDYSVLVREHRERVASGGKGLDPKFLKRRPIVFISDSASADDSAADMVLPSMERFGVFFGSPLVGTLAHCGPQDDPARLGRFREQASLLGKKLVEAVDTDPDSVRFTGEPGLCPQCHGISFTIVGEGTRIMCPVCGMTGDLDVVNGEPKAVFSAEAISTSHPRFKGWLDSLKEASK